MSIIDTTITPIRFRPVVLDLYRQIHKGIRSELFAVVGEAGRLDPADDCGTAALSQQLRSVAQLLEHHAATEDAHIEPVLVEFAPYLAERILADHEAFDRRVADLVTLGDDLCAATTGSDALHELYIELASFTGAYLLHQDVEEREISPALEDAIGVDAVVGIHHAILTNMPPQQLIGALAVMLPAINVDERTELLGGMRAAAPPEAFEAVWSLAGSVLTPADHRSVAQRLGLG